VHDAVRRTILEGPLSAERRPEPPAAPCRRSIVCRRPCCIIHDLCIMCGIAELDVWHGYHVGRPTWQRCRRRRWRRSRWWL